MRLTRARSSDVEAEIRDLDAAEFPGAPFPLASVWWTIDGDPELGYCGAELRGREEVHLTRAWVCPDLRGQGWQTRMIRARLAWARRVGVLRAETYTWHDAPASMRALIRAGFRPTRGAADPSGGAWVFWSREL